MLRKLAESVRRVAIRSAAVGRSYDDGSGDFVVRKIDFDHGAEGEESESEDEGLGQHGYEMVEEMEPGELWSFSEADFEELGEVQYQSDEGQAVLFSDSLEGSLAYRSDDDFLQNFEHDGHTNLLDGPVDLGDVSDSD